MLPLHHESQFTFRFGEDRIIARIHLDGIQTGRPVRLFQIEADSADRRRPVADAVVGDAGWVELPEPMVVRAGETYVAVPG